MLAAVGFGMAYGGLAAEMAATIVSARVGQATLCTHFLRAASGVDGIICFGTRTRGEDEGGAASGSERDEVMVGLIGWEW